MKRAVRTVGWAVFLVLLVATGLYLHTLVRQGVESTTRLQSTLGLLSQARAVIERDGPDLRVALDRRLAEARGLGAVALDARRDDVRLRLETERAQRRPELHRKAAWLTGAGLAQDLERDARIRLLEAELSYLDSLALRYERLTDRRRLLQRLQRAQQESYERLRSDFGAVCPSADVPWYDLRFTRPQIDRCAAYRNARRLYLDEAQRQAPIDMPALPDTEALLGDLVAPFAAHEAALRRELGENVVGRHVLGIRDRIPAAIAWLVGAVATSLGLLIAVRALFYFVLAPAVSRRAAVCLMPRGRGAAIESAGRLSSVSQAIEVQPDEELLVQPAYLQSSATAADMATRWLFSWRFPFSSLASRLVMLTRIRTASPQTFVVSATERDAWSEIGVLDLPAAAAMVLQPRAIVGVLQGRDRPLRITRHWRLGSLNAWLTLQLRYLVFHGPARILVKGRRGVRLEAADAGRAISQTATLGFAADVAYSQIRTETFVPYLLGRQSLFNDRFAGDGGVYLYEETTGASAGDGAGSRQLSGLFDALLRIFGL
jgi:hypothetical protein